MINGWIWIFASQQGKAVLKNKSLSARTHNEAKMATDNYVEQLKRLNVYDELVALKKLPASKINAFIAEKQKSIEQQTSEKTFDLKKRIFH